MRQRFTIKSRKNLNKKAKNKYNYIESASSLLYEKKLLNQSNAIKFNDSKYKRTCENIWSRQKVKK
jgi:hypothetical protein